MVETKLYDKGLKYFNFPSADLITTLVTGPGELVEVIVNDTIVIITIYDDIVAGDTEVIISRIFSTIADKGPRFKFGIPFTTGLTVDFNKIVGNVSGTIIYRGN